MGEASLNVWYDPTRFSRSQSVSLWMTTPHTPPTHHTYHQDRPPQPIIIHLQPTSSSTKRSPSVPPCKNPQSSTHDTQTQFIRLPHPPSQPLRNAPRKNPHPIKLRLRLFPVPRKESNEHHCIGRMNLLVTVTRVVVSFPGKSHISVFYPSILLIVIELPSKGP